MKNKFVKVVVAILFVVMPLVSVKAYSKSDYEVAFPDSYTEVVNNSFARKDGNNFNIQISSNESEKFYYTENNLNEVVDSVLNDMDTYLDDIKEQFVDKYKGKLTEDQIDAYLDSIKVNDVTSKEVTTFTKNKYPCFHYEFTYSANSKNYIAEIYQTASANKLYTITFTQTSDGYLDSEEVENIVDSFTIPNYVDVSSKEDSNLILKAMAFGWITYLVIGTVVVVGAVVITNLYKKKNKKVN